MSWLSELAKKHLAKEEHESVQERLLRCRLSTENCKPK